jgi:geranylgeranyl pyrophosphate synthase
VSPGFAVPPPVTAVLEAGETWLPAGLAAVEEVLSAAAGGHGDALGTEAAATLSAGGKRLRPLLVLLCAGPEGSEDAVRRAASIELVHVATLVHDDVLDAAPLRRGQPTVVARAGRQRAVSVGDLLFSRAFSLLGDAGDEDAVSLLSDASVSLALGELAQRHDAFDSAITEERYLWRCDLKTARLFECACLMGLGAGPDGREASSATRSFGSRIGLAFQLLDDILDVEGPPERTGKARGTDLLDGTVTLPWILARERDAALEQVDLRSLDVAGAEEVCDRIAATGATGEVRERALGMVASAKGDLAAAPLPEQQRKLLELVADGVVERYS